MPACNNCFKYDSKNKICSVMEGSPIRKCIIASLEKHLSSIKNKIICEIGCGAWSYAKNIVEPNNCTWLGIDPLEYDSKGRKIIRTHKGTANSIPLPNNHVDIVLANQSLEHWHEYKTTFRSGFLEMYRILKPGGTLIMNFPIHLHGHPVFIKGETEKIKKLWNPKLWENIKYEEWRKEYYPLEKYQGWKLISGIKNKMIPDPDNATTWLMDVTATKSANVNPSLPTINDLPILMLDFIQTKQLSLRTIVISSIHLIGKIPGIKPFYKLLKNLLQKN